MTPSGTERTRLIVLRGNSGSGKTTVARAVRTGYGRGCALVEQDYLRRVLLRERDVDGGIAPGLIAQTVRYALDHGYHVVLEGILARARYGAVLTELCAAHRGRTAVFYFDVPWEETLRRHATRPQSAEFGEAEMREWFLPRDLLGLPGERLIPQTASVAEAVALVSRELAGAPQPAVAKRSGP
ncbi:kinase [Pseudonocardia zijingensis]|uniref:Kinase n=1 Tax=Pseudonocardia zijingensis TaxID=153376 RepID=A0ABN1NC30_9PSEU